jgi:RNA polymerase sigma-70 factor (ECF subfamily)
MTDLHRATRGDRAALKRVVVEWWPRMVRWAVVFCGDAQVAEDAVQEALVRLLRHIRSFDPERPLGPWLKRLVHNACRDELSRRARTSEREAPTTELAQPSPAPGPERALDLDRASRQAIAAFEALTPRQRQILDRVDLQDHSPAEVAADLGITAGAVRNQLFTARRAVRAHLVRTADILPLLREA